jgi:hypothetical protein
MVIIATELHSGLGILIAKLTKMVADLQKLDTEQRDCLYMLNVMASTGLVAAKPPLSSLPLPTPFSATTISVTPPLPYPTSPSATVVTMGVHTTKTSNAAKIVDKVMTPAPSSSLDGHHVEI